MATKWKKFIEKAGEYVDDDQKCLLGGFMTVLGGFFLYTIFDYPYYGGWEESFLFVVGNTSLALGGVLLIREVWKRRYKDWINQDEDAYMRWKTLCINWEKFFNIIAVSVCVVLYFIVSSGTNYSRTISLYFYSCLIQFMVFQVNLLFLMKDKLELVMKQMDDINKKRVAEALEIEKQSLEKVSRSDKLRVELITNVSHDLKTPLTSIVGYLELLRKEELSDVVQDYVDVISERTEKLKEMIGSLFSLAKASSGNVDLHMERFEVNRLLEQILADMKDKIEESKLHFVTQLTEDDTALVSDNMYFYRICQNLIENALKYSAKETRVFIKTFIKENDICIEITNSAGYFMDFDKEEILERFTRGDKSRNTEGNGLGLAIVNTYSKALGGEFDIEIDCDQFKAFLKFTKS